MWLEHDEWLDACESTANFAVLSHKSVVHGQDFRFLVKMWDLHQHMHREQLVYDAARALEL